jgi:hypothetical protein
MMASAAYWAINDCLPQGDGVRDDMCDSVWPSRRVPLASRFQYTTGSDRRSQLLAGSKFARPICQGDDFRCAPSPQEPLLLTGPGHRSRLAGIGLTG